MTMRWSSRHFLISALVWVMISGCAHLIEAPPEQQWWQSVNEAGAIADRLRCAGPAAEEILSFLGAAPVEYQADAAFLVANLPVRDLGGLTADYLLANLALAHQVWDEAPWRDQIPVQIFQRYLLPHRVTQEPLSDWRPLLTEVMRRRIERAETLEQAALAVNSWCAEEITFKQTEFRDQGPLTTLAAGYGRCEEMVILFISAARAAGIPARPCSTPWWAAADNNHAWAEIWDGERFRYIAAAERAGGLDKGWFSGPASRAAAVYSIQFGSGDPAPEPLYRARDGWAVVNSTAVYTETGALRVRVQHGDGSPWKGASASAAVFNFGAFRAVASDTVNEHGEIEFVLGGGEYLVSGGDDVQGASQTAAVQPGMTTAVTLVPTAPALPAERITLRIPPEAERRETEAAAPDSAGTSGGAAETADSLNGAEAVADPWDAPFRVEEWPLLPAQLDELAVGLSAALEDAAGNGRELARALSLVPPDLLPELARLTVALDKLDRLEARAEWLVDTVQSATAAWTARGGDLPEDIFREWILDPRISPYIHLSPWRSELLPETAGWLNLSAAETARAAIDKLTEITNDETHSFFGPARTPGCVWRSRRGTAMERAALVTALLRTAGVPARLAPGLEAVQYWDDGSWHELLTEMSTAPAPPAGERSAMLLRASLTLRGIPAGERIAPALSRWQEGGWQPLDDPGSQIETIVNNDGTWTVSGPPGDYLFTAGVRDATGQPHIYCRTLTLAGDSPVELAAAMDIPFVDLPPAAWFDHPAPALLTFRAANCDYPGPLAGRRHVLAVVAPDEEPSRRMIPLIGEVVADWAQVDGCQPADISLLFSTTRPAPELSAELRRLGLRLITDPDGVALIALSSDASADVHLPIVFLVSPSGQPLLLREGYDLTIGEALRAAWARAKQTGCEDGRR